MKKTVIRVISGLLLLVMLTSCFISCKKEEEVIEETTVGTVDEKAKLPFGTENYGADFNILYYKASTYNNFYFDEVTEAGDVIQQALVDRLCIWH